MMPVSGVTTNALQPLTAPGKADGAPQVRQPEGDSRPLKPVMDEYVPEEKREPSGRYWIEPGEDGTPQVHFDDPNRQADRENAAAPEPSSPAPKAAGPDKAAKPETCRGNTDAVDREIKKLKEKLEELERQLASETDETKRRSLERRIAQVSNELRQKDTDAYRRQHTVFS